MLAKYVSLTNNLSDFQFRVSWHFTSLALFNQLSYIFLFCKSSFACNFILCSSSFFYGENLDLKEKQEIVKNQGPKSKKGRNHDQQLPSTPPIWLCAWRKKRFTSANYFCNSLIKIAKLTIKLLLV